MVRRARKLACAGDNIGDTTLTIEAEAEGYAAETRLVNVMVLDRFRIEARPPILDLAEDASTYANQCEVEPDRRR